VSRPANHTPIWKNWLLLAVGLWAFLVPSWALVPGNPTPGPKNRVWDFFSKTGISCLANPFVSLALASGKVACGYEKRVDPNCCGEQWDEDLGLYYNRARYLNTDSGRFWSQDSYEGSRSDPQTLHKYLYANSDPIGLFDPSGRFSLVEISVAAGIGATLNIALAIPNIYRNWDALSIEDIAKKLGTEAISGAVTGVVGGIGGKIFLKTVTPGVKWLFQKAVIEGAAGGALEQVAKELWGVLQGKEVTISSGGRVFVATLVGALGGGATFKIKPFIEPTVQKVLSPIFENADGFIVSIPWIEVSKETISWPGVGGAMAAKAVTDWIQDGVEMLGGLDN